MVSTTVEASKEEDPESLLKISNLESTTVELKTSTMEPMLQKAKFILLVKLQTTKIFQCGGFKGDIETIMTM